MSDAAVFAATTLTVVLVTGAFGKLRAPDRFRRALGTYEVIPRRVIGLLVLLVPTVELVLAALQWVAPLQPAVGVAMTMMLVMFTSLLVRSLVAGTDADCGCFGSAAPQRVSWFSVVRNVALVVLAVTGAAGARGASEALVPAALSGLGAGLLFLLMEQGAALFGQARPDRAGG